MTSTPDSFDLDRTYLHLTDGASVAPLPVGPDFWATIDQRADLHGGRLVTLSRMSASWPHWEMHPEGDEVVYQLSGATDLVLDEPGGKRVVQLRGRACCIVPRGIWHRGIAHAPSELLFITRGAGTQHKPVT
jgi:mannose-6-phosphate isomerase-like protein (cupin superfamily)